MFFATIPETAMHLFCECKRVVELWHNLKEWFLNKAGINVNFENSVKLLGYQKVDSFYWPLNFEILIPKKYIFSCACKGNSLNIFILQSEL